MYVHMFLYKCVYALQYFSLCFFHKDNMVQDFENELYKSHM